MNTSSVVKTSSHLAIAAPAKPYRPRPRSGGLSERPHRRLYHGGGFVHELIEARDEKRLLRFQKQLAKYKLLIIDELGLRAA